MHDFYLIFRAIDEVKTSPFPRTPVEMGPSLPTEMKVQIYTRMVLQINISLVPNGLRLVVKDMEIILLKVENILIIMLKIKRHQL